MQSILFQAIANTNEIICTAVFWQQPADELWHLFRSQHFRTMDASCTFSMFHSPFSRGLPQGGEHRGQTTQPFLAISGEPGELLPGWLLSPRYSFRQTLHCIPGVGCQSVQVPLNCEGRILHQVVSEAVRVKPEKSGPPAAQTWAWHSGKGAHWFNSLPQRIHKIISTTLQAPCVM